jgi:hypothetical protein
MGLFSPCPLLQSNQSRAEQNTTHASSAGLASAAGLGRLNTRGLGDFQRRDLFANGRVDADSVVEIFLGRATPAAVHGGRLQAR